MTPASPFTSRRSGPVYKACIFCHGPLGANRVLSCCPVGQCFAFDPGRGRFWVVCGRCGRWNLSPLEERWEAIEECERRFRGTPLRVFTDNVGLAQLRGGLELVRIGRALRGEIAAWRYGRQLRGWRPSRSGGAADRWIEEGVLRARGTADSLVRSVLRGRLRYDARIWLRLHRQGQRVLDVAATAEGYRATIRYSHADAAELVRPDREAPWRLGVRHDTGFALLTGDAGLRVAGKLLAAINGWGASADQVRGALARLEDAGNPDGYFARVAALALRTSWGRHPDAPRELPVTPRSASPAERLALHLTNRSFWGRGWNRERAAHRAGAAPRRGSPCARNGSQRGRRAPRPARRTPRARAGLARGGRNSRHR